MEKQPQVVVKVQGERATHGVLLGDFHKFWTELSRALRDYDRALNGEPLGPGGHPTSRATAVTALRLVRFRPGSGVLTLEPAVEEETPADELKLLDYPQTLPIDTLRGLFKGWSANTLPKPVKGSLEDARRTFGQNGRLDVTVTTPGLDDETYTVGPSDEEIAELFADTADVPPGQVTGRLHLIDTEPERVGIRTTSGQEYRISYPASLAPMVKALIDQKVIAWIDPHPKGSPVLLNLQPVIEPEQTNIFTLSPVPLETLMQWRNIAGPQGIHAVTNPEWQDDDQGEEFLRAINE